jgi:hypothetical protein
LLEFEDFLQMSLVGIFTGFGSALGNYFAQRSFIKHFEKITRKEVKQ